jgi:hypothetical protein
MEKTSQTKARLSRIAKMNRARREAKDPPSTGLFDVDLREVKTLLLS